MATEVGGILWKRDNDKTSEHNEIWDDTALIEAYDRAVSQMKEVISKKNKNQVSEDEKITGRKKNKKRGKGKQKPKWKLGDYCQAIFSEDGLLYEACVMSTNEQEGTCVVHFLGYGNEEEVRIGDLLASQGKHARAQQELAAQGYFPDGIDVENHSESMEWIGTRYGSLKPGKKPAKKPKKGTVSHPGKNNPYLRDANDFHHQSFMSPHACHTGFQGSNPAWQYANQLHGPSTSFIPDIPPPPPFPLDDEGVTDEEALASMLMSWYMSGYHTGYYQALRQMRTESCGCQEHGNKKCCLHCSS
ncbi:survival motor neuron protein-like isoform X2 [Tachypleus tridentatus]|uniref:survival motor neuron protein-like isoform X2 n=1 Tax=Tachypleus tridentatus TaxID=6853 RepID=UPI003FD0D059